jgi:bifunctional DNA-binding transcriptional regulator/antitoxin component of YhaV-PrlF toxin-antitoxin module
VPETPFLIEGGHAWNGKYLTDQSRVSFASMSSIARRHAPITGFRTYKVSAVGQMTLPVAAREAWGLRSGGRVQVAFLGEWVLVGPAASARRLLQLLMSERVPEGEE